MKLTKKQLCTLYQIILNEMERIDRRTPVGYMETLQDLEMKLNKELEKVNN
jgi:hypothetical protein